MIRWLARDGLRLALHGSEDATLVLQHGLCGDAAQTAEATPPGLTRLTLECRGHGASDMGEPISIAAFTDDLIAAIAPLNRPVILGGISMGAAIATRLAVLRPDLVRALILIRPAWVTAQAPENMQPNAEVGHLLATLPTAVAEAAFRASPTAQRLAVEAPDNLASLIGFFARPIPGTARLLSAISADGPGISPADLAALKIPALICGTAHDAIHPFAHAGALAALIPRAILKKLPAKGHGKPAHLAALHAAITQFLTEI